MTMCKSTRTILAVLIALAAAFAVAWQPRHAQAATGWEYKIVSTSSYDVEDLNIAGADGWEAVGITDNRALLKRSKR